MKKLAKRQPLGFAKQGSSMRLSQLAAIVLLALPLGGCGTATVNSHQVEQSISNKLVALRGVRPKSVACPSSMESTKGKVYRCTITAPAGDTIGATLTMQGGGKFDFAVDQRAVR